MDETSTAVLSAHSPQKRRSFPIFRLLGLCLLVSLMLGYFGTSTSAAAQATSQTPASSPFPIPAGPVPAGWQTVHYGSVALAVPASWPVYDLSSQQSRCVLFNAHAVYLGHQGANALCPVHARGKKEALQLESLSTADSATTLLATLATTIAGVPVRVNPASDVSHTFSVVLANAGVVIRVSYGKTSTQARQILGTLRVSGASASAPASPSSTPTSAPSTPHAQPYVVNPPNEYAGVYQGQGFDACTAPSTGAMSAWLSSPYRAVGIYIGGANRACGDGNLSSGWVDNVTGQGWNLMPLYVGLQAPCNGGFADINPSQAGLQGLQAADDAVNLARGFSLPTGTLITFDMENYASGGSCSQAVMTFLSSWTQELHARNYLSGVYSNVGSGIGDLINYAGSIQEPDTIFFANWNGSATTSDPGIPAQDWSHHQRIHQFVGGHNETYNGVTINIDTDQFDATLWSRAGSSTHHMFGFSQFGSSRYQLHSDGSIWQYNGSPSSWTELDNNPLTVAIATDGNGNLYQLHSDGAIWKYVGPPMSGWQQLDNNPAAISLAVSGNGTLYQLHNDGTVWKYVGPPWNGSCFCGWQELDKWSGNIDLAADGLGNLYLMHTDGSIYKYQGTPYNWLQVDNNQAAIAIGADGKGNLYQLHSDGTLWIYQGTPITGWQELDAWSGNIAFAVDNVGNLYVLHSDGSIWKYQGTPMTNWLEVDNNPAAVEIAADGNGNLYQLHSDGSIWKYLGPPITGWQRIDNYWQTVMLSGAY